MEKNIRFYEKSANALIDFLLDPEGQSLVYDGLCLSDPGLAQKGLDTFLQEYVPAKLALGCGFWTQCCHAHRLEKPEIHNLFFRQIMKRFESPKSRDVASRFSESLYAANSHPEESPLISVITHLFERLGLRRLDGIAATSGISRTFYFAVEAAEAAKNAFENEFDELMCEQKCPHYRQINQNK